MPNPTITSPPAARTLHEICQDVRLAECGHCHSIAAGPCTHSAAGVDGYHVARFSAARRRSLISGADLIAALAVPDAFTNATVIWTDGAA